jgi:hypothetical protein
LGNYGNADGVLDLYPKINSITTITTPVIDTYITRTEAEINMRIAHRYTVPVSGGSSVLKDIAETLVVGRLMRRFFGSDDQVLADKWLEDANKLLELIATGSASLVNSGGTLIAADLTTTVPWSSTKDYVPIFSILPPRDAWPDPDRMDDEERKRDIL